MKKFLFVMTSLLGVAFSSSAQFEMGVQASYLQGHGKHDNHASLVGAIVSGRYEFKGNMAIGTVVHKYKPSKSTYTYQDKVYTAMDDVTNIAATFDMIIGKFNDMFEAYVGMDAGVSISNHNVEYVNDLKIKSKYYIKNTYIMTSPKAGVNVALGAGLGMYGQVQYNFSPGNGDPVSIRLRNVKSSDVIITEPISKYFNIDTGIYLKLGKIKKVL